MASSAGPQPLRVAVIGGGVAGCSLIHGLRQLARDDVIAKTSDGAIQGLAMRGRKLQVSLFDMGRGVGGRAATRKTRDMPGMLINHGAPYFEARSNRFKDITSFLVSKGWAAEFDSPCGVLAPNSGGREGDDFIPEAATAPPAPRRYHGIPGMSGICEGLLSDTLSEDPPMLSQHFGTMVAGLERLEASGDEVPAGWRLFAKDNTCLGEFDWLAVTGSGLAHPRWTTIFGGPPPLVAAEAAAPDEALGAALAAVARLENKPVTATMMAFRGEAAKAWGSLPFCIADIAEHPVLSKIVIRAQHGVGSDRQDLIVTVVLHSTHEFSEGLADVFGATSTAARVGGASAGSANREKDVTGTMLEALKARLVPKWISEDAFGSPPAWGPHLHRWGAAFPKGPGLPAEQAVSPSARVVFAGDYVSSGEGFSSLETAALSGLDAAKAIALHS